MMRGQPVDLVAHPARPQGRARRGRLADCLPLLGRGELYLRHGGRRQWRRLHELTDRARRSEPWSIFRSSTATSISATPAASAMAGQGAPSLARPVLPQHLTEAAKAVRSTSTSSSRSTSTSRSISRRPPGSRAGAARTRLAGMVAALPLERGKAIEPELDRLRQHKLLRGIRRLIQTQPDPDFCVKPDFIAGLKLLAPHDFAFDICVYHHHLPNVIKMVRQCPEVRFVLDHIGKPGIKAGRSSPGARTSRRSPSLGQRPLQDLRRGDRGRSQALDARPAAALHRPLHRELRLRPHHVRRRLARLRAGGELSRLGRDRRAGGRRRLGTGQPQALPRQRDRLLPAGPLSMAGVASKWRKAPTRRGLRFFEPSSTSATAEPSSNGHLEEIFMIEVLPFCRFAAAPHGPPASRSNVSWPPDRLRRRRNERQGRFRRPHQADHRSPRVLRGRVTLLRRRRGQSGGLRRPFHRAARRCHCLRDRLPNSATAVTGDLLLGMMKNTGVIAFVTDGFVAIRGDRGRWDCPATHGTDAQLASAQRAGHRSACPLWWAGWR